MLEAYAVAVRIRLIDGVTSGLMGLSAAFAKAHGNAGKLQKQLDAIKFKMAAGGALLGAGALGFWMIDKAIKPAEEYAHQLNIMKMAGMSNIDIANATALAWKNTGTVITTTATENLRAILDLKNILGSMKDAQWALPIVTKVGAVMASSSEANIKNNAQDIAFQMAKALDIIGAARDPGTFAHEAGLMSKVVTAFQNRVTPKQFQGVFQYARQAKFDLSDEFKYEFLPSLMLEMSSGASSGGGGSRGVGPMLAAIYRVTNQGYINKKSVPLWEQLGLIKPGTAISTTTTGTVTAPLKDRALAAQNPFLFATKVLEPAIKAKFGNVSVSREREIIGELFRGNQLAAAAMMEFISKPQNYLRDQQIIRGAMPFNKAYDQAQKNDPYFQYTALHKQYENALTALGIAALPLVIRGVHALANTIQPLGAWLMGHPNLTKGLVLGLGALSAAMAFGGMVMLLSAAFGGLKLLVPVVTWAFGGLAAKLGLTQTAAAATSAAVGGQGAGLVAALWRARAGLIGLGLAAAGFYYLTTHPVKGKFDKGHEGDLTHFKPDWLKRTGLDKPLTSLLGLDGVRNALLTPLSKEGFRKSLDVSLGLPYSEPRSKPPQVSLDPWSPQAPQPIVVHNHIHLDGKKIAESVTKVQGREAAGAATGPTRQDTRMSPLQPAHAF